LRFKNEGFEGVHALEIETGKVSVVKERSCVVEPLYWVASLEGGALKKVPHPGNCV